MRLTARGGAGRRSPSGRCRDRHDHLRRLSRRHHRAGWRHRLRPPRVHPGRPPRARGRAAVRRGADRRSGCLPLRADLRVPRHPARAAARAGRDLGLPRRLRGLRARARRLVAGGGHRAPLLALQIELDALNVTLPIAVLARMALRGSTAGVAPTPATAALKYGTILLAPYLWLREPRRRRALLVGVGVTVLAFGVHALLRPADWADYSPRSASSRAPSTRPVRRPAAHRAGAIHAGRLRAAFRLCAVLARSPSGVAGAGSRSPPRRSRCRPCGWPDLRRSSACRGCGWRTAARRAHDGTRGRAPSERPGQAPNGLTGFGLVPTRIAFVSV